MISRKTNQPLVKLLAIYLVALFALASLSTSAGCGPSAREKTLSTTLLGVNGARDGFLAWEDKHENAIIDACNLPTCTLEQGEAKLAAYRAKAVVVVEAFEVAYRAIALAALDKNASLPEVINAAVKLYAAVEALQSSTSTPVPTRP